MLIDQRRADGEMRVGLNDEMLGDPEPPGVIWVGPDIRPAVEIERLKARSKGLGRAVPGLNRKDVEALLVKERIGLVEQSKGEPIGVRQGDSVWVRPHVRGRIDEPQLPFAQRQRQVV